MRLGIEMSKVTTGGRTTTATRCMAGKSRRLAIRPLVQPHARADSAAPPTRKSAMSAHPPRNRRIVLAARPRGLPAPGDFRLEETAVPEPGVGQVLLRTRYLSLDPYMRNLMEEIG